METRQELIEAVAKRYAAAGRQDKSRTLDEFVQVTQYHRKHAIRVLAAALGEGAEAESARKPAARIYDDAVREALIVLWEVGDRICGKRLKALIPVLVESMERNGHLQLDDEVRRRVLEISAATIDRILKPVREAGGEGKRKTGVQSPLRRSVPVRTFGDWNDPPPGYFEMDFVAHCGKTVEGSHAHSLVLTDIASGWTEGTGMVVREQTLVVRALDDIRAKLPFPMLGLDVDNDGAFMNDTVIDYCREQRLELTRSRPYRKNDQAWVEQKNGAVVRRLVGYGRLEGLAATEALTKLHGVARLYVNFFQPSFKLKSKTRDGAKVTKSYYPPAMPYERLIASVHVSETGKTRLREQFASLDPVQLLRQIREVQQTLAKLEVGSSVPQAEEPSQDLGRFLRSFSISWREGEVRPTHRKRPSQPRNWRTRRDPFEAVWPTVEQWLNEKPEANAKEIFLELQQQTGSHFQPGQLRTLQRRVKQWRSEIARRLIFSYEESSTGMQPTLPGAAEAESIAGVRT